MKFSKKMLEMIENAPVYDADEGKREGILKDYEGLEIKENCPRCGAKLLENKHGNKWCSEAGYQEGSRCRFGLEDNS
jgi:ribosomal protein S27AE